MVAVPTVMTAEVSDPDRIDREANGNSASHTRARGDWPSTIDDYF